MSRRRSLPTLAFCGVIGVIAAAAASSAGGSPDIAVGSFGTVVRVTTTAPAAPVGGPSSGDPLPAGAPVLTVPGWGYLAGFPHDAFDEAIIGRLLGQGAQAVSVAVAKDGYLVHAAARGIANPATGEQATPADRFRIASNSKILTATVILQLVAAGELTLDDHPLARLAAQFGVTLGDPRMADVTVRQLLDHTSGFSDFSDDFFRGGAVGCEDVTVQALRGRLRTAPGTYVNYSNENFCFLGLLIETITGEGYEQAVTDRLLTPLGITDMRITGNDDLRSGEVDHAGGRQRNFMEVLGGAGAWIASAPDLVKIVDSLDTNRPGWHPLPPELATEMRAKNATIGATAGHWLGLGLRLWSDGTWGHTGTIQNAHSMVLHQPDGFTWAVLVSGEVPRETDDLKGIVRRAFEQTRPPAGPVIPITPDDLSGLDNLSTTVLTTAPTTASTTEVPGR